MKRTAEVKRDAAIGEAEARKDAGIKVMFDWLTNQPIGFLVGRGNSKCGCGLELCMNQSD